MSVQYFKQEPYVGSDGFYVPEKLYVQDGEPCAYKCIITKKMFIEAYNRWIRRYNPDTLDDCEFMNDWE